ncbi:TolC family protein [Pedobacter sp.]|uniref:TolC family protein n=1 Tax=Pedobacter sp. TaxID=1411316 RepID=UPI0031E025C6
MKHILKNNIEKRFFKPLPMLCFLGLLVFSLNANAQKKQLNIDQAIQMAIDNNLGVKAGDLEIKASQSLKRTAGELPKLDLNAQLGQYNSTQFDQSYQVSQTIPFPTLFGARKQLINAEIRGKQLQRELTVLELKNQVRNYYYQTLYLQHNHQQLKQLDSLYADFIKIAQLRYKTGDTKKVDVSTAQAKQGEINLLLRQNEVYLANAHTSLAALLNTKEDFELANQSTFAPLQINNLLDSATVANHPAVQSFYQEALIAAQSKKVERSQTLPDITLGYVNQSLIGFQTVNGTEKYFGAGNRFNSVNIGLAIPLTFGANKARVRSLDYRQQAAEANAQQQQRNLMAQMQNALLQYQQDMKQYQYFVKDALPNAKEMLSAAQLGYKTGDTSYLEYLYALQTATDIQLNYLKSIQQVNQSVINIYSIINQ